MILFFIKIMQALTLVISLRQRIIIPNLYRMELPSLGAIFYRERILTTTYI